MAIGHHEMGFRFVLDGVDDVGGTKRDVDVGHIVLMEQSGFVRGNAYAEDADVGIFQDEMVVRLLGDWNGYRGLRVQGEREE